MIFSYHSIVVIGTAFGERTNENQENPGPDPMNKFQRSIATLLQN